MSNFPWIWSNFNATFVQERDGPKYSQHSLKHEMQWGDLTRFAYAVVFEGTTAVEHPRATRWVSPVHLVKLEEICSGKKRTTHGLFTPGTSSSF
eukprot:s640_g24.t1